MTAPQGRTRIVVQRPRSLYGMVWEWKVSVDGRDVGSLDNGGSLVVDVDPGPHVVRVGPSSIAQGFTSRPFALAVGAGEEVQLVCRGTMTRPHIERSDGVAPERAPAPAVARPDPPTTSAPQVVEVSREEVHIGDETLLIDNSQSASPSVRVKRLSKEWTRSYTVEAGDSTTVGGSGGVSVHWFELKAQAERALDHKYSTGAEERQTYDEEVTITVGAKTNSRIVFSWKEIRQHGFVMAGEGPDAVKLPFELVVGVTFDQRQVDVVTG